MYTQFFHNNILRSIVLLSFFFLFFQNAEAQVRDTMRLYSYHDYNVIPDSGKTTGYALIRPNQYDFCLNKKYSAPFLENFYVVSTQEELESIISTECGDNNKPFPIVDFSTMKIGIVVIDDKTPVSIDYYKKVSYSITLYPIHRTRDQILIRYAITPEKESDCKRLYIFQIKLDDYLKTVRFENLNRVTSHTRWMNEEDIE